MNLLLGLIEFVKVDRILKNSCDNNEDFCEFHQRFLAVLNSLPSKNGFNDFSISKSGSVKKFAKVDWIMDAIVSITENMGILQPEYNSNTEATQNSFLQKLEQFNFEERGGNFQLTRQTNIQCTVSSKFYHQFKRLTLYLFKMTGSNTKFYH